MKKLYLILMLFALPFMVQAQTEFKNLYEIFKDKKGVTIVQLDKDLIDLYKKSYLEKETEELIRKLKTVNILNVTIDKKEYTAEAIDKLVKKSFNLDNYQIIKSSNYQRGFSKVYVKKSNGKVSNLVVINSGWREYNLIFITGEIELNNLSKLAYALNIDGIENLHEVGDSHEHFFHSYKGLSDEDIEKIKKNAEELKRKFKDEKFFKGENFNSEEFEKYWEDFGKRMEEWGEKLGESIENMVNTVIIDDEDFNISQSRSGKTIIKISPDNESVYIVDGSIVANSKIKEIEAGKINRISVIRKSKDGKDKDNYVIIYTGKPCGEFISFQTGILKFRYLGKEYKYDITQKDFPGFVINGKKTDNLDDVKLDGITQIRPITKAEKEALKCKKDRILIETK